jgi:hypothetical protein
VFREMYTVTQKSLHGKYRCNSFSNIFELKLVEAKHADPGMWKASSVRLSVAQEFF